MCNEKYELTDETIEWKGRTLHRIRALKKILGTDSDDEDGYDVIQPGELGGFIESENNLCTYDKSWIEDDSKVYDNANVSGDSRIQKNAEIFDNAMVCKDSLVCGTQVYENAMIIDSSIYGDYKIYGTARITNCGMCDRYSKNFIYGDTFLYNSEVIGFSRVYDNAQIYYCTIVGCDIHGNANLSYNSDHIFKNVRIFEGTYSNENDEC